MAKTLTYKKLGSPIFASSHSVSLCCNPPRSVFFLNPSLPSSNCPQVGFFGVFFSFLIGALRFFLVLEVKLRAMASAAGAESVKRHPEERTSAPEAVVPPEASRFPKDVDGGSHGPVWQSIAPPLKADPANDPNSEEWNQAKQAFKETGLLNRISDHVADP